MVLPSRTKSSVDADDPNRETAFSHSEICSSHLHACFCAVLCACRRFRSKQTLLLHALSTSARSFRNKNRIFENVTNTYNEENLLMNH